jgi:hypothetical protein
MSDALNRITDMANQLMQAEEKVAQLEADLKSAKIAHQKLEREDLPTLMTELEISKISLNNGASVEVVLDLVCSIPANRRESAHRWLKDHGFGGIIKTNLELSFGKDEIAAAKEIAEEIVEKFARTPELTEGVHAQTLKSFIKERKEWAASNPEANERDPFPDELFGVFEFNKAKITMPKAKK